MFDYKHIRDPKRVQLTKTKLRKGAMHWWKNLKISRDKVGLPKNTRGDDTKTKLEKRYISITYKHDRLRELRAILKNACPLLIIPTNSMHLIVDQKLMNMYTSQ